MNFSSKDANNTVYLGEVAVSHTKQFLVTRSQKGKKIATLTVIVPGQFEALASSWFLIQDLIAKSICEACEKRGW